MTHSKTRFTPAAHAILVAALLIGLFWAIAQAGSGSAHASAADTSADDMVLSGPATALIGQSVTYTAAFTVPQNGSTFYLSYRFPKGFSVTGHSDGASVVNNSVFWAQGVLGTRKTVTVTGKYQVGSCPVSQHSAALGDIYDPGSTLPSDRFTTIVSDVHCVNLPLVIRPTSAQP